MKRILKNTRRATTREVLTAEEDVFRITRDDTFALRIAAAIAAIDDELVKVSRREDAGLWHQTM